MYGESVPASHPRYRPSFFHRVLLSNQHNFTYSTQARDVARQTKNPWCHFDPKCRRNVLQKKSTKLLNFCYLFVLLWQHTKLSMRVLSPHTHTHPRYASPKRQRYCRCYAQTYCLIARSIGTQLRRVAEFRIRLRTLFYPVYNITVFCYLCELFFFHSTLNAHIVYLLCICVVSLTFITIHERWYNRSAYCKWLMSSIAIDCVLVVICGKVYSSHSQNQSERCFRELRRAFWMRWIWICQRCHCPRYPHKMALGHSISITTMEGWTTNRCQINLHTVVRGSCSYWHRMNCVRRPITVCGRLLCHGT